MQSTNPRNLREVLKAVKETLDKDGAPLVIINELTSTQGFLRQIRALGDAHNAQFENIIPHNFGKEDILELRVVCISQRPYLPQKSLSRGKLIDYNQRCAVLVERLLHGLEYFSKVPWIRRLHRCLGPFACLAPEVRYKIE
jgi:hypothetical protein